MARRRTTIIRALATGVGVLAIFSVVACGDNGSGTGTTTVTAPTTSTTRALPEPTVSPSTTDTSGTSGTGTTTAAAANLPDCAGLQPAINTPHTNCQLSDAGATITFDYATPDQVEIRNGSVAATEKLLNSPPGYPSIKDIDGDGTAELLVPMQLAATNTNTAIYHVDGLVRAGELPGSIAAPRNGEIKTTSSISAASAAVGFWQFSGSKLQEIITVAFSKRPGDPECTIEGTVNNSGMSDAKAIEHYCALARN